MSSKILGTVKTFNPQRGYGFLIPDSGQGVSVADVFFHHTELKVQGFRTVDSGQRVEFTIVDSPKGRKAVQVTLVT